jgi:hypothetical protein
MKNLAEKTGGVGDLRQGQKSPYGPRRLAVRSGASEQVSIEWHRRSNPSLPARDALAVEPESSASVCEMDLAKGHKRQKVGVIHQRFGCIRESEAVVHPAVANFPVLRGSEARVETTCRVKSFCDVSA